MQDGVRGAENAGSPALTGDSSGTALVPTADPRMQEAVGTLPPPVHRGCLLPSPWSRKPATHPAWWP